MGDIDLNDPDVEHAATKIQAGFKGMKARKDVQSMKDGNKEGSDKIGIEKTTISPRVEEEKVEIRQHDEKDTNEVQQKNEELNKNSIGTPASNEVIDIDLKDPDVEQAATKIQAGFKGMKARKDVQSMKDGNKEGSDKDGAEKTTISPKVEEEKVENRQHDEKDTNEVQQKNEELNKNSIGTPASNEVIDIDLNDPDVEHAA